MVGAVREPLRVPLQRDISTGASIFRELPAYPPSARSRTRDLRHSASDLTDKLARLSLLPVVGKDPEQRVAHVQFLMQPTMRRVPHRWALFLKREYSHLPPRNQADTGQSNAYAPQLTTPTLTMSGIDWFKHSEPRHTSICNEVGDGAISRDRNTSTASQNSAPSNKSAILNAGVKDCSAGVVTLLRLWMASSRPILSTIIIFSGADQQSQGRLASSSTLRAGWQGMQRIPSKRPFPNTKRPGRVTQVEKVVPLPR
jgi:hypothetical protein